MSVIMVMRCYHGNHGNEVMWAVGHQLSEFIDLCVPIALYVGLIRELAKFLSGYPGYPTTQQGCKSATELYYM